MFIYQFSTFVPETLSLTSYSQSPSYKMHNEYERTENQSTCVSCSPTTWAAVQKHKPGVLRSSALSTLIALFLLHNFFPLPCLTLQDLKDRKGVIFTVLHFLLLMSGTINKEAHPDSSSLQVGSTTLLIKGKEPSAVPKSSVFLTSF